MLHPAILCLLFSASGFAGLVFEVCWCRLLLRALGAGTSANSCVFAAFMAGAAIGAILGWRFPAELGKIGRSLLGGNGVSGSLDYLRAYGRLELLSGLSGWLCCLLLSSPISEAIARLVGAGCLSNAVRFGICFLLLVVPCSAMGAGLASLVRGMAQLFRGMNYFPALYGCNAAGAAVGGMSAAFFFLPLNGIAASSFMAALIDVCVFGFLELICPVTGFSSRSNAPDPAGAAIMDSETEDNGGAKVSDLSAGAIWSVCVFLSGFLALVFEITCSRVFSLVLGSSVYSVASVLLMVLLGAGSAALLVQLFRPGARAAGWLIFAGFLAAGIFTIAGCYLNPLTCAIYGQCYCLIAPLSGDLFARSVLARLALALVFVFPPAACLGSVLPLCTIAAQRNHMSASLLYAVNCLGAFCACLLYTFTWFPVMAQIFHSALLACLMSVALLSILISSLLLLCRGRLADFSKRVATVLSALLCTGLPVLLVLLCPPAWDKGLLTSGSLVYENPSEAKAFLPRFRQEKLLRYEEGMNSTISACVYPLSNSISIKSDGKVEATLPLEPSIISPGSDLSTHVLLAALPVVAHEGAFAKAFLVGLGSGVTASTLMTFPELSRVTIAEIEPAVINTCESLNSYNGAALSPANLNSDRLRLLVSDARFALASSPEKYDLIISQPADPWVSGSADLYTAEFWRLSASRLADRGVFCQWLQLYAIPKSCLQSALRTFSSVFSRVYVCHTPGAGEILLLGFKDGGDQALMHPDRQSISRMDRRILQSLREKNLLAAAGISNAYDALSLILYGPEEVRSLSAAKDKAQTELNTDDRPFVEYATSRSLLEGASNLHSNFQFLANALSGERRNYLPGFNADSEEYALMGRALARSFARDSSALRSLRKDRSLASLNKALSINKTAFACWSKAVVLRSGHEEFMPEMAQLLGLRPSSDRDRLALFDFFFERNELDRASCSLFACSKETQGSVEGLLRKAFLLLKEGDSAAASRTFTQAIKSNPCSLEGLLGGSYASYRQGGAAAAADLGYRYLSINPWDARTQLYYTFLCCRCRGYAEALSHAICASKLKPDDASALLVLLKFQLMETHTGVVDEIITLMKNSTVDPQAEDVIKLLNYNGISDLLDNRAFSRLVNTRISSAEDPENGYKILGEP